MMTNEVINEQSIDIQPAYTLETLPKLLPQQQLMLKYIIDGNNYTDAYKMAGYTSVDHADKAAWMLVTRNPLKAHLEYFRAELAKLCTRDYITNKLQQITDMAIANPQTPETAIKALAELNKMQGNYANTNTTNIQINTSVEDIRRAKSEYIKDK
jgi:phage terminase small subunit